MGAARNLTPYPWRCSCLLQALILRIHTIRYLPGTLLQHNYAPANVFFGTQCDHLAASASSTNWCTAKIMLAGRFQGSGRPGWDETAYLAICPD